MNQLAKWISEESIVYIAHFGTAIVGHVLIRAWE